MCVIYGRMTECDRCHRTLSYREENRHICKKAREGRACWKDEANSIDHVDGRLCPICRPILEAEDRLKEIEKKVKEAAEKKKSEGK
ncbi:hypothetical protein ACHAPT_008476 [Fusarium lateritium]